MASKAQTVFLLNRFNGALFLPNYNKKLLVRLYIALTTRTIKTWSRKNSVPSYLYIPKGQAQKSVSVLPPVIDWTFSISEIQELKQNLNTRRKQDWVDVDQLAEQCNQMKAARMDVHRLETARERNAALVRQTLESGATKDRVQLLVQDGRRLREACRMADIALTQLQVQLIPQLLQLPNTLHPRTPNDQLRIEKVHGIRPPNFPFKPRDHTQIATGSHRLHFTDIGFNGHYLEGCCAVAELATLDYFADQFSKADFVPFSNPDFCKPIVVEGCGYHFNDPSETFHLKADRQSRSIDTLEPTELHLVGSASLPSFCAFHAKCSVDERHLPLRYYTAGSYYAPPTGPSRTPSLFESSQASRLHFFAVTAKEATEIYDRCVGIVEDAYVELDVHFRIVHVPAHELLEAESRRTDFQMWAASSQAYRTVASISACGDYIGKRLWMCYEKKTGGGRGFLQMIHGTAVSFPDFLGCLVESSQTVDDCEKVFPTVLHRYMCNYENR